MFHPQRAAAHRVGRLPLLLLVACPQSQLDGTRTSASGQEWRHGSDLLKPHLVDEVERHGPLSDPHLLGLPVLAVLVSDAVHALLQPASRLVLLPVLLPLQSHARRQNKAWKRHPTTANTHLNPGAGVQHDVLDGALDVLRPRHQPRYFVVVTDFFPLGSRRRLRVLRVPLRSIQASESAQRDPLEQRRTVKPPSLAAVDDDVLGSDATLQHAHLGVVAPATEQPRGLDAEVSDAFLVVVHDAETILLQEALVPFFNFLEGRRNPD